MNITAADLDLFRHTTTAAVDRHRRTVHHPTTSEPSLEHACTQQPRHRSTTPKTTNHRPKRSECQPLIRLHIIRIQNKQIHTRYTNKTTTAIQRRDKVDQLSNKRWRRAARVQPAARKMDAAHRCTRSMPFFKLSLPLSASLPRSRGWRTHTSRKPSTRHSSRT